MALPRGLETKIILDSKEEHAGRANLSRKQMGCCSMQSSVCHLRLWTRNHLSGYTLAPLALLPLLESWNRALYHLRSERRSPGVRGVGGQWRRRRDESIHVCKIHTCACVHTHTHAHTHIHTHTPPSSYWHSSHE